ncbi:MAG: hypothetical protein AUF79_01720 [Crenarchaeota archaeon 13_1_20CM_2_51_8]|nr:MAG: hypothetical protein AUF79_01720 [Crenarchaeota archaeon 13_1_20CM_2_51_8]
MPDARSYWLDLFTGKTWKEFLEAGSQVSGFRESQWKPVQKIQTGDYLLCYLTGVSRWIGILEVTSGGFQDNSPIWKDETFPCRVRVKVVAILTPETAVPIHELRDDLSIFKKGKTAVHWTGYLRGSPRKWKSEDGQAIVKAVLQAEQHPIMRPVDRAKLERRPRALKSKIGPVTIPEPEPLQPSPAEPEKEASEHTEMQWTLLKLGSDMGLDVWVARNDRGRSYKGHRYGDLQRLKSHLPRQFDDVTNKIIENIDVLWMHGNAFVAAFEIESTTSIYSGLLRMADLVTMQPNLKLPLYVVAPDDRRLKVFSEVNRPTFSKLTPPLKTICRFIAFSTLRKRIQELGGMTRYMKPDFLEEVSEWCEVEET